MKSTQNTDTRNFHIRIKQYFAIVILSVFSISSGHGQNMQAGFIQLENGQFEKAKNFFNEILSAYPKNNTARVCYGRALGLSGSPQEAIKIFKQLNLEEPNNMEFLLNLSEAHLWNRDGASALIKYNEIIIQEPQSSIALLGMANAYSMVQNYSQAHRFIGQSIAIDPTNSQAQISKKYIQLAYANYLATQHQAYAESIKLLDNNLRADSLDQESIQLKASVLIQSKKFSEALKSYKRLSNPVSATIGQSLAQHFLQDDPAALNLARKAIEFAVDEKDVLQAHLHFNQALLWNDQIKEAQAHSDSLSGVSFAPEQLLLLKANLALNASDFTTATEMFQTYLSKNKSSFDANLGLANALHALNMDQKAYHYAFQTQEYYPGQKDATLFVKKLNSLHRGELQSTYQYEKSQDGSFNRRWSVSSRFSITPLSSVIVQYERNVLYSKNQEGGLKDQRISVAFGQQLTKVFKLNASYRFIKVLHDNAQTGFTQNEAILSLQARLSKNHKIHIGLSNEVQDFNASLLEQNINTQSIFLKNSLYWKAMNFGVYSELFVSALSDGNDRVSLFNSIYKQVLKKPELKIGINQLMLKFGQNETGYFSPGTYHQVEIFTSIRNSAAAESPWKWGLDMATGYQISDGMTQLTWRTKAGLERNIRGVKLKFSAMYSSIEAKNNNGFSYLNTSFQLVLPIGRKPIFYRKLTRGQQAK